MEVIVDLSNRFDAVRDQEEREKCLIFATTAAHEFLHDLSQSLCIECIFR